MLPWTQDDKGTYSHLVKPALNSAASPFAVPGAEHWDSTVTLNWACRGIGEKKMGVLRDTMLQVGRRPASQSRRVPQGHQEPILIQDEYD